MNKSFKVMVLADNSGKYCGNGLRFANEQAAQDYAVDLAMRWMAVSDWKVEPSEDEPNR